MLDIVKKRMRDERGNIYWTIVLQILVLVGSVGLLWHFHKKQKALENLLPISGLVLPLEMMFWQFRDAKRQRIKAEEQRLKTEEIAQETSTKFIGNFPEHVDRIIEIVGYARDEFCFMADCVDYSSFSYPEGYKELFDAISRVRKQGCMVKMLICGEPAPITLSSPLFGKSWDEIKAHPAFNKYFDSEYPGLTKPEDETAFYEVLKTQEAGFREQLNKIGVIIRASHSLDVGPFMWIADEQEAVFLFATKGAPTSRVAFRTQDHRIVCSLKAIFSSKWDP